VDYNWGTEEQKAKWGKNYTGAVINYRGEFDNQRVSDSVIDL
jgi:hypothetical protein